MTASWSKGRSAYYGYYFCQTKGCDARRNNIRKEVIEGDFENLLRGIQPKKTTCTVIHAMLKDLWEVRRANAVFASQKIRQELETLDRKVSQVMEHILATTSPHLISAYEKEIQRIEETKAVLAEKAATAPENVTPFDETYRTALEFLLNPCKLWDSGKDEGRLILLRLAFADRLPYCKNEGYRAANTALLFNVLVDFSTPKYGMVRAPGLEPGRPSGRGILSPLRLPIPPCPHEALG